MGWVYSVLALDPVRVQSVVRFDTERLVAELKQRGVPPEDVGSESWDEIDENAALLTLVSGQEWDLDKSLDDLQALCQLEPALKPVLSLLERVMSFEGSLVPERFWPAEEGFMGMADAGAVAAAAKAIAPFAGSAGRLRLLNARLSPLHRLFTMGLRRRLRENAYVQDHWDRLAEAITTTHERKHWFGLAMG